MSEKKYIFKEGVSNSKFPEPSDSKKAEKSDYQKALEIVLGYSDDEIVTSDLPAKSVSQISQLSMESESTEENELIQKAKEFRLKFLGGINADTNRSYDGIS